MIEFKDVTATYKENIGIFNITFKIEPGEMVFLMGPTGAGKSTVLKAIYSAIDINKGDISIDGQSVPSLSKYQIPLIRQKIGMIFQDFKLLNNRTVLENVALPLRILGLSSSEIYKKVDETLSKVGLSNLYNSYPLELSGGEQQRVCIARALVKTPKIILADEPTGNLDPNVSDEILDLLDLFTENGTAVLMSTHNFPLIKPRKKRFIELSNGRIID
jgi:cell division transport system ATP-binding protein